MIEINYKTPENMGISSKNILNYINILENSRLSTHDVIIMRGNSIVYEAYWAPFNKDYNHRMYSVTKSFVALAIGFLYQDGVIDLDDKIINYFPDEAKKQTDIYMREQTIKDMLTMRTAKEPKNWFKANTDDRVRFYFENDDLISRPSGTIFQYDSSASFVLGALVEKVSGKSLIDNLKENLFNKIGVSDGIDCLKCPGGHSWGDSGALCTARDLLKIAKFVMDKGVLNGKQLLNTDFLNNAVSKLTDNNSGNLNEFDCQGYGYCIWRSYGNSFWFNGMGCQIALCIPDKDIIMVYNGDNQGNNFAKKLLLIIFLT